MAGFPGEPRPMGPFWFYMKYSEKFKDPRWQKKRLEILERDGFACRLCCDSENTLNAHHLYYINSRSPWEYPNSSIITLCEECHKEEHDSDETIIDRVSSIIETVGFLESIDSVIDAALIYRECGLPPNIEDVADRLFLFSKHGCDITKLLIFLQGEIDEATSGK